MHVKNFFSEDYILIENFCLPCRVGTTQEERSHAQMITLTIQIFLPLQNAGKRDDIGATIDYSSIILKIRKLISSREFQLIESVAESIASKILNEKGVSKVSVEAKKKVFSDIQFVGAFITRIK